MVCVCVCACGRLAYLRSYRSHCALCFLSRLHFSIRRLRLLKLTNQIRSSIFPQMAWPLSHHWQARCHSQFMLAVVSLSSQLSPPSSKHTRNVKKMLRALSVCVTPIFHLCREVSVVTTKLWVLHIANKSHIRSLCYIRIETWIDFDFCEQKDQLKAGITMSDSEEHRFDSILLALAEQHKNGVPEVRFKQIPWIWMKFNRKSRTNNICSYSLNIFSCLVLWLDFWPGKQISMLVERMANGKQ